MRYDKHVHRTLWTSSWEVSLYANGNSCCLYVERYLPRQVFGSLQCREYDKRLFIKGNKVSKSHTPSIRASGVWGSCEVVSPSLKEAKVSVFPTISQVLAQYICCPSTCTSCFLLEHASAFGV